MLTDCPTAQAPAEPLERGLSVVVPVYNSAKIVPELVSSLCSVLPTCDRPFEIILVNDASSDDSWEQIAAQCRAFSDVVRGVNLSRNFGQHNATLCGIRLARFDVTITMDDDFQHPPEEIPKLLRRLDRGDADVVYGVPAVRRHSRMRNFLTRLTKQTAARLTGLERVETQSPFRAFYTQLRDAFAGYMGPDVLLDVLLGWGTSRFATVPVEHAARRHGRSNYNAARLFNMAILTLTAYSTVPLRLASWIGLTLTVFGVAVFGYVVAIRVLFGSVPGFPFLASLIAIFGGAQLFALGLFGEYLTRVFNHALGRPTYVIKELRP